MIYIDSSAIVKLAILETETATLQQWLGRNSAPLVSSALATVEVRLACRRLPDPAKAQAADLAAVQALQSVNLIPIGADIVETASTLGLPGLRSLDALQLATALTIHQHISVVLTYDDRLGRAAAASGFTVTAPGA